MSLVDRDAPHPIGNRHERRARAAGYDPSGTNRMSRRLRRLRGRTRDVVRAEFFADLKLLNETLRSLS